MKQQYWLYVSMQRQRHQFGSVRFYPLQLPEQRIDGVTFQPATKGTTAREALRRLQSRSRLTVAQAEEYLREVRAERLTDGRHNGQ